MFFMLIDGNGHQKGAPQDREMPMRADNAVEESVEPAEILALFRLLTREPPHGHDFKTCPICTEYGITEI
jgi:hypothetical protein